MDDARAWVSREVNQAAPRAIRLGGLHSASDFAIITSSTQAKLLARRRAQAPIALLRAAHEMRAVDFKAHSLVGLTGASPIQDIIEGEDIQRVTMDEVAEPAPVPTTGAGIFALTFKALVNDDLRAFRQINDNLYRSLREWERGKLLAPLLANSGNGQIMTDGQPMFSASHGNVAGSGGALSVATLGSAFLAMRRQKDKQGILVGAEPALLVIPPELETTARQVLAAFDATKIDDVNPYAGSLELVVEPGLVNPTAWYVVASHDTTDGLAYSFLDGWATPRVETREGWDVLGAETRIIWHFGARFVSTAGWYRNPGA